MQQDMIESLIPHLGRLNKDLQVIDNLILPAERGELLRTDLILKFEIGLYVTNIGHT